MARPSTAKKCYLWAVNRRSRRSPARFFLGWASQPSGRASAVVGRVARAPESCRRRRGGRDFRWRVRLSAFDVAAVLGGLGTRREPSGGSGESCDSRGPARRALAARFGEIAALAWLGLPPRSPTPSSGQGDPSSRDPTRPVPKSWYSTLVLAAILRDAPAIGARPTACIAAHTSGAVALREIRAPIRAA